MPASLRFGRAEIRLAERQLLLGGQPAMLGARALDLSLALLERRDRAVSKNELLELVWPRGSWLRRTTCRCRSAGCASRSGRRSSQPFSGAAIASP